MVALYWLGKDYLIVHLSMSRKGVFHSLQVLEKTQTGTISTLIHCNPLPGEGLLHQNWMEKI